MGALTVTLLFLQHHGIKEWRESVPDTEVNRPFCCSGKETLAKIAGW